MPPRCKNPNKPAPDDPGWLHYVEPYFGMGAVLLANNPEGISEVANDLNGDLTNFWNVLRNSSDFPLFQLAIESTPFSEAIFSAPDTVQSGLAPPIHLAWKFFVRCRQSLAGRMDSFTGITRNRTRRGMNAEVSAWLSSIEGLPAVHARLIRVLIRNQPALEVICKEDGPRTLIYADPPYLHSTRSTTTEYGDFEMTGEDHEDLLVVLSQIKGRFILSGYHSPLYDLFAAKHGWRVHEFDIANHAAGGAEKKRMMEVCFCNFS